MNCQEFWNTMPELGGAAEHPHASECPACAARLRRQNELAAGLRAVAAGYQRVSASERVEARLRDAFRGHAGMASFWPRRGRWMPALTWAAAFAGVIAFAVFLVRGVGPGLSLPLTQKGADVAMLVNADDPQGDYEGFIPLPNAARLADNDEVNLVRVEVPRSAMIALGFEVSPERASELVAADVMLGPDGLARAVRFLDSESSN